MNADGQMIEMLRNSQEYQNYERAFTDASNLPLALRPAETWQLPLHGKRKENPWCALMAGKSKTCAACLQIQERLAQSAATQSTTVSCAYGLSEVAAPVKHQGQTIGYLQSGQVLRENPTEAAFQKALAKVRELGVAVDEAKAHDAFFATPVLSAMKLDAIGRLLGIFAERLAIKANQIAVVEANSMPPAIVKAQQYILEHFTEELSLADVARAVHTSTFYFCKLFRASTGKHFTEFVSEVRVEKAKTLLLNPELRVSEIAYEVGFQSLTHFNRVFKKLAGVSPTDYRSRLPA